MMLHSILRWMVSRGHTATVYAAGVPGYPYTFEDYTLDGVNISARPEAITGARIVLTHLDRTVDASRWAAEHDARLAVLVHNHLQQKRHPVPAALSIYNTDWLAGLCGRPGIVVHPPIRGEDYRCRVRPRYLTLINRNEGKGARTFYRVAKIMPEHDFLAVAGAYGEQLEPTSSNVTTWPMRVDARAIYRQTAALIMPSLYESYGRTALEAAYAGVPVIARKATWTGGLQEALGDGGVWVTGDNPARWRAAITGVLEDLPAARRRIAKSLERVDSEAELEDLEHALGQIVRRAV